MQDDLARHIWTTMPAALKRLLRPLVLFLGLALFHRRVPNAIALAFLMGHSWKAEEEVWRWDGRFKPDTFTTLKGGHLPFAGRIAEMEENRLLR